MERVPGTVPTMKYGISALARKTGLSIHTLRFYEKAGLLRYVERTPTGRRVYTEDSLGCLFGVLCLKQAGFTLPEIKKFFDSTSQGSSSLPERLLMLRQAKANLQKLADDLARSIQLVNFFLDGGEEALAAQSRGEDPNAAFPFFTKEGIVNFPYLSRVEGRLEVSMPEFSEHPSQQEGGNSHE